MEADVVARGGGIGEETTALTAPGATITGDAEEEGGIGADTSVNAVAVGAGTTMGSETIEEGIEEAEEEAITEAD